MTNAELIMNVGKKALAMNFGGEWEKVTLKKIYTGHNKNKWFGGDVIGRDGTESAVGIEELKAI